VNIVEIKSQLVATAQERDAIDTRLALLALLALATIARELSPTAAYIVLTATDQNDSGELWVQTAWDTDHEEIGDWKQFDEDPIAYYMHGGNEAVWLPFMTVLNDSAESEVGEYLLDIAQVLNTLPLS
jgi:hypothetical protein